MHLFSQSSLSRLSWLLGEGLFAMCVFHTHPLQHASFNMAAAGVGRLRGHKSRVLLSGTRRSSFGFSCEEQPPCISYETKSPSPDTDSFSVPPSWISQPPVAAVCVLHSLMYFGIAAPTEDREDSMTLESGAATGLSPQATTDYQSPSVMATSLACLMGQESQVIFTSACQKIRRPRHK